MTGELGAGLITQTGPFDVMGVTGVASVAMGGFGFACAVMNDGSVQCWGNNQLGQLRQRQDREDIGNPGAVLVLRCGPDIEQIVRGREVIEHTPCARRPVAAKRSVFATVFERPVVKCAPRRW